MKKPPSFAFTLIASWSMTIAFLVALLFLTWYAPIFAVTKYQNRDIYDPRMGTWSTESDDTPVQYDGNPNAYGSLHVSYSFGPSFEGKSLIDDRAGLLFPIVVADDPESKKPRPLRYFDGKEFHVLGTVDPKPEYESAWVYRLRNGRWLALHTRGTFLVDPVKMTLTKLPPPPAAIPGAVVTIGGSFIYYINLLSTNPGYVLNFDSDAWVKLPNPPLERVDGTSYGLTDGRLVSSHGRSRLDEFQIGNLVIKLVSATVMFVVLALTAVGTRRGIHWPAAFVGGFFAIGLVFSCLVTWVFFFGTGH